MAYLMSIYHWKKPIRHYLLSKKQRKVKVTYVISLLGNKNRKVVLF